jgi:hypothetical protein
MKRIVLATLTVAVLGVVLAGSGSAAGRPETEPAYAEGQTYAMIGVNVLTQASAGLLSSPPIYGIGFPVAPGTTGPITLPSGYRPQCNPCSHGAFPYHDHVLTGAPGLGADGTGHGEYRSPWRIVVMLYSPSYAYSPSFQPITDEEEIPAAEAAGKLVPINQGGGNPFEIWTQSVLNCPLVALVA